MPAETPVIGYVLKMYPRFSETFVVSEILAREAQGEKIVIFSLRPTTDARFHPELARVKAPVVHISRPTSANRLWQNLAGAVAADGGHHGAGSLTAGIAAHLPELLALGHEDAHQAVEVAQAARAHGVTHLHAHFASVATTVARMAGKVAGLPYSFTAHAKDIFHEDVDPQELAAKFADAHHAITISQYNVEDLKRRFPESTGTLKLVRNGLDLERFPYVARPVRTADRPARLLAVGRLVEKKGFEHVIDAVAALRAAGHEVTAEIAGDGPLAAALRRRVAEHGLTEHVHLLGPITQAEVAELLGTRDVFVAPFVVGADGNADGLPTVLLEAMARGLPCVAADVTAVGEVVKTGQTGWLVPTGDTAALTAAVAEAIAPGADHSALTAAARAQVEELFGSAGQAARLRELVTA